jgi:hypothetical protein
MIRDCSRFIRSRWFMLAFCVALGGVVLLASWLGGSLASGLIGLAVLTGSAFS